MTGVLPDAGLVLVLVLAGGVFAAAEIALVSLRESQLRSLAVRGKRGARVAALAADPNRFLSAVQIGVTLMGFLSAAVGGATIAAAFSPVLQDWGLGAGLASTVALVLVTIVISYVSIVLGELAAKRLALQRPEGFALALAPLVDRIARVARPVIWLLSKSTNVVVRMVGGDPHAGREEMTDEELRDLVAGHRALGTEQRRIALQVFDAGDRQLREVMLPRPAVDFVDASTSVSDAVVLFHERPHSRYPVTHGSPDNIAGFVHVRDLLVPGIDRDSARVGEFVRDIVMFPGSARVLPSLTELRRLGRQMAIVADEYGGTAGIVTIEDLVEELIGEIRDEYDTDEARAVQLRGGDLEVDGLLSLDEFAEASGVELPSGPYETVAGFIVARLGHLPEPDERVDVDDASLVISAVEGRRVARIRVARTRAVR
ncbi:MAG: hemolysin family protein [Streptosporangiales bacterium]